MKPMIQTSDGTLLTVTEFRAQNSHIVFNGEVPSEELLQAIGASIVNTATTDGEKGSSIILERNAELAATDWWGVSDRTMTTEQAAYRQALRDIPSQAGFPTNVTWPTKPTE